jgi:membrane fusion protein, heavy metal efflux system
MHLRSAITTLAVVGVAAGMAAAAYLTRDTWQPWIPTRQPAAAEAETRAGEEAHAHGGERIRITPQARANLKLVVKPVAPESYWKTLQIPGMVVDRPGQSDRGVSAPFTGVVTKVLAHPGDTVRVGEPLFTLRLIGESVHNAQAELFKATREVQLVGEQMDRLKVVPAGAIPQARLIELENQERRHKASVQAARQELLTRGLTPEQVDAAAGGRFVTEVTVAAPIPPPEQVQVATLRPAGGPSSADPSAQIAFELKELKVNLGEQVQAGQTLCVLSNHQALLIEGRAFKQEAFLLERAAQEGWPVRAVFAEEAEGVWPALENDLRIHHLANTVDPISRTFAFYLPLANQSRAFTRDGRTFLTWRFRPGQRARLLVPVEELKDVFVLPSEAVVRDGPEAYVFRQNGDVFERKPVHVVHEDRSSVVLANDGSIGGGQFIARNGAAALNRALKAQAAGGDGGHDHHGHNH